MCQRTQKCVTVQMKLDLEFQEFIRIREDQDTAFQGSVMRQLQRSRIYGLWEEEFVVIIKVVQMDQKVHGENQYREFVRFDCEEFVRIPNPG